MSEDYGHYGEPPAQTPASVSYACGLLAVQAVLWATAALGVISVWADRGHLSPAISGGTAEYLLTGIAAFVLTAGLAAGSALLSVSVSRGQPWARRIAVGLETLMVGFGLLIAHTASAGDVIGAELVALAGLVGSGLSLAAAIGLLLPRARHFAGNKAARPRAA